MKKFACLTLLLLFTGMVHSRPLFITFWEMIEVSPNIVIATLQPNESYNAKSYVITIESILKGSLKPGKYKVKRGKGAAYFNKGQKFVAFINEDNQLMWYGIPIDKVWSDIQNNTILELAGFYDFNAYLVAPNTITLAQLKQYLDKKEYTMNITGNLHSFSNKTLQMETDPVTFDIEYIYRGAEEGSTNIKVNGLSYQGFREKPGLQTSAWDQEIGLVYESNLTRPFTINGEILPQLKNDKMEAYFWAEEPEELTFDELQEFLMNEEHGYPYYQMEVTTNNQTYILETGKERGMGGNLFNYEGQSLKISGTSSSNDKLEITLDFNYYDKLILKTDSVQLQEEQLKYTGESIIRIVRIKPLKLNMYTKKDNIEKFIGTCIISYKSTLFAPNVNYGK